MNVIWTKGAIQNLKNIFDYYEMEAGKKVAFKITKKIKLRASRLKDFPNLGRVEKEFGNRYRSIKSDNYRIFYKIDDQIYIMLVFDMRRNPVDLK